MPGSSSPQVFLSYAWGGDSEAIADRIEVAMAVANVRVRRDKRDLGFKQSIREFMREIGEGHAVVVILSDKYLRSKYCMFELIEIFRQGRFVDRIFPVLLPDARIHDASDLVDYLKYWEDKRADLERKMRTIDLANQHGVRADLDLYDEIRGLIARVVDVLRDIVLFTPDDLEELIAALAPDPPLPGPDLLTDEALRGVLVDDDADLIAATGEQLIAENRLDWARRFADRLLELSHPSRPDLEAEAHARLERIAEKAR